MTAKTTGRDATATKIRIFPYVVAILITSCFAGSLVRLLRSPHADIHAVDLPSQIHDFGIMIPGSKNRTTFVATNTMAETLTIDRIDRSCGCTLATSDRDVILPGQSFEISALLSARDYPENMTSLISVHGHAGAVHVDAEYRLRGDVENIIEFPDPGGNDLRLGTFALDELPAQTATNVTRGAYPLDFDELRVDSDSLVVSADAHQVTGRSWRVAFQVNSTRLLGTSGFPVTFRFIRHGVVLPETVVKQVFFEIGGPVVASPSSVLFTAAPGQHLRKTIAISGRQQGLPASGAQIVSVVSSSASLIASCQSNGKQDCVTMDYTAPAQHGSDRGEVIVEVLEQGTVYKLKVSYLALIS